jgi:exodeoxyribonuclease VII small subunit
MATNASGEFEEALGRLEEIVGKLEREGVGLDESVLLFKEGKGLAQKCERLLKDAQSSIEAASRGDAPELGRAGAPLLGARPGAPPEL